MKIWHIFILIFCFQNSLLAQNKGIPIKQDANGNKVENVFLYRDTPHNYYKYITDFVYDDNYLIQRNEIKDEQKKENIYVDPLDSILLGQWCTLHQYNDEYFVYAPSDWGNNLRFEVSDDLVFATYYMDGPYFSAIVNSNKLASNQFEIEYKNDDIVITATCTIIDQNPLIAIWEISDGSVGELYLMTKAESVPQFPLIAVENNTERQMEFTFEQPDYTNLILSALKKTKWNAIPDSMWYNNHLPIDGTELVSNPVKNAAYAPENSLIIDTEMKLEELPKEVQEIVNFTLKNVDYRKLEFSLVIHVVNDEYVESNDFILVKQYCYRSVYKDENSGDYVPYTNEWIFYRQSKKLRLAQFILENE